MDIKFHKQTAMILHNSYLLLAVYRQSGTYKQLIGNDFFLPSDIQQLNLLVILYNIMHAFCTQASKHSWLYYRHIP